MDRSQSSPELGDLSSRAILNRFFLHRLRIFRIFLSINADSAAILLRDICLDRN
jgi:hypothetical protein